LTLPGIGRIPGINLELIGDLLFRPGGAGKPKINQPRFFI
jgi:hypothetical protein